MLAEMILLGFGSLDSDVGPPRFVQRPALMGALTLTMGFLGLYKGQSKQECLDGSFDSDGVGDFADRQSKNSRSMTDRAHQQISNYIKGFSKSFRIRIGGCVMFDNNDCFRAKSEGKMGLLSK